MADVQVLKLGQGTEEGRRQEGKRAGGQGCRRAAAKPRARPGVQEAGPGLHWHLSLRRD